MNKMVEAIIGLIEIDAIGLAKAEAKKLDTTRDVDILKGDLYCIILALIESEYKKEIRILKKEIGRKQTENIINSIVHKATFCAL